MWTATSDGRCRVCLRAVRTAHTSPPVDVWRNPAGTQADILMPKPGIWTPTPARLHPPLCLLPPSQKAKISASASSKTSVVPPGRSEISSLSVVGGSSVRELMASCAAFLSAASVGETLTSFVPIASLRIAYSNFEFPTSAARCIFFTVEAQCRPSSFINARFSRFRSRLLLEAFASWSARVSRVFSCLSRFLDDS